MADPDKARASTSALARAKAKGDRARWSPRLLAISAMLLTLSAVFSLLGGHVSIVSLLSMLTMWAIFGLTHRRRHQLRAARVKPELDEAYALAGTDRSQMRVMVEAAPDGAKGVRVDAEDEAHKAALAEAEAEAEKEDAFADFDRRLAEAEKKKSS